jgi:hypothetical protein
MGSRVIKESEETVKLRRQVAELERKVAELEAREKRYKQTEKQMAAECAVTRILAESTSPSLAISRIIQAICETTGWELGEFWSVDRSSNILYYKEGCHKPSVKVTEFELLSRNYTFAPGIGLPGRILSSRRPNWITDVVKDYNFPRAPLAEKVGLHSAFGFPIILGDEILGVMGFFRDDIQEPDEELLQFMSSIGSRIADFNWNNWHDNFSVVRDSDDWLHCR